MRLADLVAEVVWPQGVHLGLVERLEVVTTPAALLARLGAV